MENNYAFIDAQNLNSGLHALGFKIDWKRFREYLRTEKHIEVAYVFLGFMLGNQDFYLVLQKAGFVVVFKEILTMESGEVKGNIDAELVLQAMVDYDRYHRALIVSGDGDFTCLLRYLDQNNKFLGIIAPHEKGLSSLVEKVSGDRIVYLRSLRKQIEYKPERQSAKKEQRPPVHSTPIEKSPLLDEEKGIVEKKILPQEPKIKKPHIYSRNNRKTTKKEEPPRPKASPKREVPDIIYGGFGV